MDRLLGKRTTGMQLPDADHRSLWVHEGKPAVYVSQPYALTMTKLRRLVRFCDEHGLTALVDSWPAWHFPGRVLHVAVMTAEMGEKLQM
jgi:hypothetical protein